MNRRRFLAGSAVALAALGGAGWYFWPKKGMRNACLAQLPHALAQHELVRAAWHGIDATRMWDCHVHLAGSGDGGSGIRVNPQLDSLWHPIQYAQKLFYLNAGCVHEAPGQIDQSYIARLRNLRAGMAPGVKLMLLAFEAFHRDDGAVDWERTSFYVPNDYARDMAKRFPADFAWMASIHPYRSDAVSALTQAARDGTRAVKWLPNAMNIDPASPRCDAFYETLVKYDLPLLTHAGKERAVWGGETQDFGNPLRLRRALEHGVRVIVAHCASLGEDRDLDRGANAPYVGSFDLFARLMDDPQFVGRVFGDISAMTQFDRASFLQRVLVRPEWHGRLLHGSDYPLPGILPIYNASTFADLGMLPASAVPVLDAIQQHNPLLFDFVLKRSLRQKGRQLPPSVFHTRDFFLRGKPELGPD